MSTIYQFVLHGMPHNGGRGDFEFAAKLTDRGLVFTIRAEPDAQGITTDVEVSPEAAAVLLEFRRLCDPTAGENER
jgi:hypothetical protein